METEDQKYYTKRRDITMKRLPLEDITILDLSWVIAGPHGTRMFSDLGARVIKVESSKSFDVIRSGCRRRGNDNPRKEGGWAYNDLNHGKLDISINLKSQKGRETFEELLKISDIMICNFGANAFKKLCLTFEDVSQINPKIIVMNASGLGDWGPYSSFVTFAPVLQSMTGIEGLVGYENTDTPYGGYPPLADYMGSLAVCNHLIAAIEYRRRTGKGQFIDLSQGEAAASYMGTLVLDWQVNKTRRGFIGNHHYTDNAAPHNCYKCKGNDDQWCVIAVVSEAEWKCFCSVVDPKGTWTSDPRFATLENRIANQAALDELVEAWTKNKNPAEVGELLQAVGVSGAPVQFARDILFNDEHMKAREYFMEVDFPPSEKYPDKWIITGPLFRISGLKNNRVTKPGPAIGQHKDYILKEILGKSQEWIDGVADDDAFV